MIGKHGHVDYWLQVESAFRTACQEADVEGLYYTTETEKVPTFFVTKDNLDNAELKPFLEFYQMD
jgi:hypothetical protein